MKLVLSREASADLDGICGYITHDLESPDTAKRIAQKITRRMIVLRNFPRAGRLLTDISEQLAGYRLLAIDKYLVLYRCDEDRVVVLRIIHASLDYTRLF